MGDSPPSEILRVPAAMRPVQGQLVRLASHGHHLHSSPGLRGVNKVWRNLDAGTELKMFKSTQKESQTDFEHPSPLSPSNLTLI